VVAPMANYFEDCCLKLPFCWLLLLFCLLFVRNMTSGKSVHLQQRRHNTCKTNATHLMAIVHVGDKPPKKATHVGDKPPKKIAGASLLCGLAACGD